MAYYKRKFCALIFLALVVAATAQTDETKIKYTSNNKGKFFMSWGGNRASYLKSDISFKGEAYNFELKHVKADDKPKGWHVDYINPSRLTIPQTNAKLGYFISDTYSIAIGLDHMKYVVRPYQNTAITGTIHLDNNETGSLFNGTYNGEDIKLIKNFLQFEHTDGLNFIYAEFGRFDDISKMFTITNTDVFQVKIATNAAVGILLPKTNATLLLKQRYDAFNLSGFGTSVGAGINMTFFKHFYIQGDLKGGYITMHDVRTTTSKADSATNDFFYFERIVSFGGIFRLF